jgi:type II secretory pathway pseudopilin PulG
MLLQGFGLRQNLLDLLMLGMSIALLAPRYATALFQARAEAAAKQVIRDLGGARAAASASGNPVTIVFSPTTNTYQIDGQAVDPATAGMRAVRLSDPPLCATLLWADFDSRSSLCFDEKGAPSCSGRIAVCAGDVTRMISIDPSGAIAVG